MIDRHIRPTLLCAIVISAAIATHWGGTGAPVSAQDAGGSPVIGEATAGPVGTAFVGAARQVTLSRLPLVTATRSGSLGSSPRPRKWAARDPGWAALKAQAALRRFTSTAPTLPPPQLLPDRAAETPAAFVNFNGDDQNAPCTEGFPPDMAVAIGDGANPIVQAINACLSVFAPSGARLSGPVSLQTFFGLNSGTVMGRPRALFDWYNHRFVVLAIDTDFASNNNYDIAVSKGDDPTGDWWTYRIAVQSHANSLPEFARLGQDRTVAYPGYPTIPGALYVASNLEATDSNAYNGEEWLILPKGPMYNGAQFQMAHTCCMMSNGVLTDSTQPANVWSPYETPRAEYLITSKNRNDGGGHCSSGCNGLTVWAISNPFSFVNAGPDPHITGVTVGTTNTYFFPPPAQQPVGPPNIETLDTRISGQATYAEGFVIAALNAANPSGGTQSIIYKVRPFLNRNNDGACSGGYLNLCPEIVSASVFGESVLNYGGTNSAFFPTPQPDLEGNVTLVFNYSSLNLFPSLCYVSQRFTQGNGFVDSGFVLQAGQGPYIQNGGDFGEYTAVAPAGVAYAGGNGGATGTPTMLFAGMYSASGGIWKTRIGANRFNAPSQP